ncbi:NUDIX hydrolase [Desulfogranum japonicum]|uniref:NUDIX hydrolase n=1 Tax=Desulfogranum japonicum TaxID=231447 RepID=UPI000403A3E8|nr:NUDIX domain-containing protein [Desulfogranum japonicum]
MNRPIKEAAVAAIILNTPAPEVLVLKRVSDPRDPWSGQYAFPGGRRDNTDKNLLETCRRETYEECGVTLPHENLVKQYPVRTAGNRMGIPTPVTTFLFELSNRPQIALQDTEISHYEWLSMEFVTNQANIIQRPMLPGKPGQLFPCIPVSRGYVWGFTFETLMMVISDRYIY